MLNMTSVEHVAQAARSLKLLDPDGKLQRVSSLEMVELIVSIEEAAGITIPSASVREECFESVENLAKLVQQFIDNRK